MKLHESIAAALLLCAPVRAGVQGPAAELLRGLETAQPEQREHAARALAALGPGAMGELFRLIDPAASSTRDQVLAQAFAFEPAGELRVFLGGLTRSALPAERLRPALLVLREAGAASELARCLDLAAQQAESLQTELVAALSAICARDAAACEQALALARQSGDAETDALARGLAEAHTSLAARALVRLAASRPDTSGSCLSLLLASAGQLPRPIDPELLALLREPLGAEDHPAAQELLLLAGRLEDDEAVPILIERLSSARPGLQANALWSLRRITGLGLGPDERAWSQWFREESLWWKQRSPGVLALLRSGDGEAAGRALGELGQRYWRRKQAAAEVCDYLARARGESARMACGVLARLGCACAVAVLESRLADPDPAVQESVRAALAGLTGKKVPARRVGLSARR